MIDNTIKNALKKWFRCVEITEKWDKKAFLNHRKIKALKWGYNLWAGVLINTFNEKLKELCVANDKKWLTKLLAPFNEFSLWRMWYSKEWRWWKWSGKKRIKKLVKHLLGKYKSVIIGWWISVFDIFFFTDSLWIDCRSDALWNLLSSVIAEYTQEVCSSLTVPVTTVNHKLLIWDSSTCAWRYKYYELPTDSRWKPYVITPINFASTAYRLVPNRILEEIIYDKKLSIEILKEVWINIEVEFSNPKITKKEKRKIISEFEKSVKSLLRNILDQKPECIKVILDKLDRHYRIEENKYDLIVSKSIVSLARSQYIKVTESN